MITLWALSGLFAIALMIYCDYAEYGQYDFTVNDVIFSIIGMIFGAVTLLLVVCFLVETGKTKVTILRIKKK